MAAPSAIPRSVWVLGFVSMLMDISSEMIHALLPLYLTVGLGASALVVGVIEGVAEATALVVKVFSGVISDRLRNRKWLTAIGYGLAAFSKPLFALATGPVLVFGARFLDRIGKGIRGAPRDALIADITPAAQRGAAFGLRQSLDTIGAFTGPLLAMALMLAWNDDFRAVFWVAVIPAMLSFALVVWGVREPKPGTDHVFPAPRPSTLE
jgi:sugar phosphate permease